MIPPPDLSKLTEADKDALIRQLLARLEAAEKRIAALEARLKEPAKTPNNSSLPPSKSHKPNRPERAKRSGPRQGSMGRKGGGRPLAAAPDQFIVGRRRVPTARRRSVRTTTSCMPGTTRSTCRRFALW